MMYNLSNGKLVNYNEDSVYLYLTHKEIRVCRALKLI
jgi:hypothetical protein